MSEACKAVTVAKDTGISVNLSCSSRRSSFSRLVAKDSAQKTQRRRTKREVEDDVADAVEVSVGSRLFPLACLLAHCMADNWGTNNLHLSKRVGGEG